MNLSHYIFLFTQKISFDIEVIKNPGDADFDIFDSREVSCGETFKEDLFAYNELLGNVVADNAQKKEYLISPTLTRIEGVTLFYDKVHKFTHFLKATRSSEKNVRIKNIDYKLAKALIRRLGQEGFTVKRPSGKLFLNDVFMLAQFVLRILVLPAFEVLFLVLSKAMLKAPVREEFDCALATYYDFKSGAGGAHKDKYFQPLLEHMVKQGKSVIVFNRLLHGNNPSVFYRFLKEIAAGGTSYENTLYNRFLSPWDVLKALGMGLFLKPRLGRPLQFSGEDISHLTRLSLADDYRRFWWFYNYLEYFFMKKVLSGYKIGRLFYPYENYPWEKLFVRAKHEAKSQTRFVGFQHSSTSLKPLNFFPSKREQDLPVYPEKILTVGRVLRDVMRELGHYPEGRIEEGCALLHRALFEPAEAPLRTGFSRKVAFAFSFDITIYDNIVENLVQVFQGLDLTVYLKLHPLAVGGGVSFNTELPENFVIATNIPWDQLLREADILLYDDNSLGIEALRYNISVGAFQLTGQAYDTDRLFHYKGQKVEGATAKEFQRAIEDFYAQGFDALPDSASYNRNYMLEYFTPVTDETLERFLQA